MVHVSPLAELELWALDPQGEGIEVSLPEAVAMLDSEERARWESFARTEDRRNYLAAHSMLRKRLAARTGVEPGAIRFYREPCPVCGQAHGRPALLDPPYGVHFSLSRSPTLVLVAIAAVSVGVDVEPIPAPETVAQVTPMLHPHERELILGAPPEQRGHAFARVWARKEAYLKGVGSGIAGDLAAEDLSGASGDGPAGWRVYDVPVDGELAAAVALGWAL